jgi:hypothetical protein
MHIYKAIGEKIIDRNFPNDHREDEEPSRRRCTSYGEDALSIPYEWLALGKVVGFFKSVYNGFKEDATIWNAYEENMNHFERPLLFKLDQVCNPEDASKKNFQIAYTPCILPTNFSSAKNRPYSYEFYHPSVSARQLGFGQLSIHLFFADRIQHRNILSSALEYSRIKALTDVLTDVDLTEWAPSLFHSSQYKSWWLEWKLHIQNWTVSYYCTEIDLEHVSMTNEV